MNAKEAREIALKNKELTTHKKNRLEYLSLINDIKETAEIGNFLLKLKEKEISVYSKELLKENGFEVSYEDTNINTSDGVNYCWIIRW